MTENQQQLDNIPESKVALWAYRLSRIPFLGLALYIILAPIALIRIGSKGRTGFYLLRRGLILGILYSGLLYSILFITAYAPTWAFPFGFRHGYEIENYQELSVTSKYYLGKWAYSTYYLNKIKHHKMINAGPGDVNDRIYIRYYENGNKQSEGYIYNSIMQMDLHDIASVLTPEPENYSKGKRWTYWDEQGNKTKVEIYDNGKLIKTINFKDGKPVEI